MGRFEPYNETSVDGFIEAGNRLDVSEATISFKEIIDNSVIVPYHNVISKYYQVLTPFIREITFSDEDYYRYYQQPKLFCYDIYGTPELAYSLLYINDMPSVMDFTKKTIKAFTEDILDVVNELMSLNEADLKECNLRVSQ